MSKSIRIIAGLGNPEDKYERTLHNAGFWFVDALARKYGGDFRYEKKFDADYCRINLHGEDVWLVKPQSYMNQSGGPFAAFSTTIACESASCWWRMTRSTCRLARRASRKVAVTAATMACETSSGIAVPNFYD